MKKLLNKKINNGITLIALVITIVVLIILATVVINLSLGDNGIFNRARTAKQQYQNADAQEQTDIAKATNEIDSYVDGSRETVTIPREEYEKMKQDLINLQNEKMNSNNIIIESQTKTSNQYATIQFDNKEGYIILTAIPKSVHYLVHITGPSFRVFDGNATGLADSVKSPNTSISAYVVYLKNQ